MNPTQDQLDGHCVTSNFPWSIVDSSTPNAHLAAVLAGFMVTAIVFLLRRESDEQDSASRAHTIAMFLTGVVILGLDSYMFGSLASMHPVTQTLSFTDPATHITAAFEIARPESQYVCAVVWTHGMVASGMLAVGGTLLVAGLGWTTTQFARNAKSHSVWFACLGNIATGAIIAACAAALWDTASMYIRSMAAPPFSKVFAHGTWIVGATAVAFGLLSVILIFLRTTALRRRLRQNKCWQDEADPRYGRLAWANGLTMILAVAGPVYANVLSDTTATSLWAMWSAMTACLFLPGFIFVLIALSVPGPAILWEKGTLGSAPDAQPG